MLNQCIMTPKTGRDIVSVCASSYAIFLRRSAAVLALAVLKWPNQWQY